MINFNMMNCSLINKIYINILYSSDNDNDNDNNNRQIVIYFINYN